MTDTQSSAPGTPVAAKPRGNSVVNLLKFGPDPLEFMTKLAQTSELGIVAVRTGNQTLRLVTDPALIKRAIELDDPPTLGRGRFPRVTNWYGGEGIFVKTSGPEHARQRDTLGRPIWNDPQTPQIARRRADAMSAAWREGEPVDVWHAFRRLHFETDWEQLTGEQADEAGPARARDRRRLAAEADPAGRDGAVEGARRSRRPQGQRAPRRARRRAGQAAARGAGSGGGGPALAARAPGRRGRRDHRRADPRDRQAPVPGPDPRLPDLDLLGARAQPAGRAAVAGGDRHRSWRAPRRPWRTSSASRTCTASCWRRCGSTRRPSGSSARRCRTSTSTGTWSRPGDYLVMSQFVTHRDPRLWDDPLRFDPGALGRRRDASGGDRLLPVLGRSARLPRLAAGAAPGDARGGHRSASAGGCRPRATRSRR